MTGSLTVLLGIPVATGVGSLRHRRKWLKLLLP